jgi:predicted transcriptional regulator
MDEAAKKAFKGRFVMLTVMLNIIILCFAMGVFILFRFAPSSTLGLGIGIFLLAVGAVFRSRSGSGITRQRSGCMNNRSAYIMLTKLKSEIELASRHLEVIRAVVEYQPIGIMKLSDILDLPYHRVRYSLRILEQEGYIRASPAGAVATARAADLLGGLEARVDELIALLEAIKKENSQNL